VNLEDLIRQMLPVQRELKTEIKLDLKKGWLIIAVKIPEAKR